MNACAVEMIKSRNLHSRDSFLSHPYICICIQGGDIVLHWQFLQKSVLKTVAHPIVHTLVTFCKKCW